MVFREVFPQRIGDMAIDRKHNDRSAHGAVNDGTAKSGHKYPPKGPLIIDTRDLGRQPGAMREVRMEVPAPADLGIELIKIPQDAPLTLDLRVESVAEGVLVSGVVSGTATAECGRCLTATTQDVRVSLTELYAYPGSATEETADEDEVSRLVDDRVDLEPLIRNAIVPELPLTPLCKPDCEGLCAGCGERWEDLPDDHAHDVIDPRWAALRDKFGGADEA